MKVKLSKSQEEVIKKLQKGDILHHISGICARCFFTDKNISWATIGKLEKLKLTDRKDGQIILTNEGENINYN